MDTFFSTLSDMAQTFILSIQSVLNMIETGVSAFMDHQYPNVLGSVWSIFPIEIQLFAIAFLIVGLFVALMGAVLRK